MTGLGADGPKSNFSTVCRDGVNPGVGGGGRVRVNPRLTPGLTRGATIGLTLNTMRDGGVEEKYTREKG